LIKLFVNETASQSLRTGRGRLLFIASDHRLLAAAAAEGLAAWNPESSPAPDPPAPVN